MADTMFSRANPSPRYRELVELYRAMHAEGEKFLNVGPEKTFRGSSLPPEAHHIKAIIEHTGALSLLDYGSGKGQQYDVRNVKLATGEVVESIVDYWGVDYVHCYDPSYTKYSTLPQGRFDGVICTDVLEHCPEDDLPWILAEIFSFADRFVYANVACYPAMKRLPTGENAHCTVRAPEWWLALVRRIAAQFPDVIWELSAHVLVGDGSGRSVEQRFRSNEVAK
jgi:hypothetical protein